MLSDQAKTNVKGLNLFFSTCLQSLVSFKTYMHTIKFHITCALTWKAMEHYLREVEHRTC